VYSLFPVSRFCTLPFYLFIHNFMDNCVSYLSSGVRQLLSRATENGARRDKRNRKQRAHCRLAFTDQAKKRGKSNDCGKVQSALAQSEEVQSRLAGLGFQGGADRESEHYLRRLYRLTIGTRRGTNLLVSDWSAVDDRQSWRPYRHVYCDRNTLKFLAPFGANSSKFKSLDELSINLRVYILNKPRFLHLLEKISRTIVDVFYSRQPT